MDVAFFIFGRLVFFTRVQLTWCKILHVLIRIWRLILVSQASCTTVSGLLSNTWFHMCLFITQANLFKVRLFNTFHLQVWLRFCASVCECILFMHFRV